MTGSCAQPWRRR